ncbi:hypothetical protein AB0I86_32280 [Streptomyces sp. NPDC049950]|uniref:hypothetical protein n=1 Tax=Streptomyces sp. NPDC049950 TaxID=3156659 RepID=UPI00342BB3B2
MKNETAPQTEAPIPDAERGPAAETAICRRFEVPEVSGAVLRVLQGASCLCCRMPDGELRSAGRACTVSPSGDTLWWDVRAHDKCMSAAGQES